MMKQKISHSQLFGIEYSCANNIYTTKAMERCMNESGVTVS